MEAVATAPSRSGAKPARKYLRLLLIYLAPVLLAVLAVVIYIFSAYSVLPRLRISPGYGLVNQEGQTVTSEDMRGNIVLYSFAYTNCAEECDPILSLVSDVQSQLQGAIKPEDEDLSIEFVTITLDAVRDTPSVLMEFANARDIDLANWSFLGGDELMLKSVIGGGFEVYYQASANERVDFDPAFFLVDEHGLIRSEYRSRLPDSDRVVADIESLLDESRSGGLGGLVYGAAHKLNFSCNLQ